LKFQFHLIDKLERDIFFHVDITDFKAKWDEFNYPNCSEIYKINLNVGGGTQGIKPPPPNLTLIYFSPIFQIWFKQQQMF
jgi:hypothetical protein